MIKILAIQSYKIANVNCVELNQSGHITTFTCVYMCMCVLVTYVYLFTCLYKKYRHKTKLNKYLKKKQKKNITDFLNNLVIF